MKHFTTLLTKRLYIEKSLTADKTETKQYIDAIAVCISNLSLKKTKKKQTM